MLTPINDSVLDGSETVTVEITSSTAYHTGLSNRASVIIADDDAPGDPNWTGSGNGTSGNSYGWSNTSSAGGSTGEIGGKFTTWARASKRLRRSP